MKTLFAFFAASVMAMAGDRTETDDQSGTIVFKIDPDWAAVTVDSTPFGQARQYNGSASALRVEPGTHIVKITAEGYLDYEKRIYISDTREVIEVQLRPAGNPAGAAIPRKETKTFGSLYLLGSPVNPSEQLNAGGGASFEISLNSRTSLLISAEALLPVDETGTDNLFASFKLGTVIMPFDGDLQPQFGVLLGGGTGPQSSSFIVGGIFRGMYLLSPRTNLFLGVEPDIAFGNNGGVFFNFSAGVRIRLGK